MSFSATVVKILIASPEDVKSERDEIEQALFEWNVQYSESFGKVLLPIRWESAVIPSYSKENDPQEIINEQIVEDCDCIIGIFWTKIGTPTKNSQSGTIEELEKFIKNKKCNDILVYFKKEAYPQESDFDEIKKLQAFKQNYSGIYSDYSKEAIIRHLYNKMSRSKVSTDELCESVTEENSVGELSVLESLIQDEVLSNAAILLIKYVQETQESLFGVRWKQEETVDQIIAWEMQNKLTNELSRNYEQVIRDFADRGLLEEDEYTAYNNVRQYKLATNIVNQITDLSDKANNNIKKVFNSLIY